MKKSVVIAVILIAGTFTHAQGKFEVDKYANFSKYGEENSKLEIPMDNENRVVFMGNSITEAWKNKRPEFFNRNNYICRGISGQVTHQMLLRFRTDVTDLNPKAVVILAGTNDIAQNSGYVSLQSVAENIFTMAELADYHGIKVILCSVLPAIDFPWKRGLEPATKIIELNDMIKKYADDKHFPYVDYYSEMVDDAGGLKVPDYTSEDDLVHPNVSGYEVMEKVVTPVIKEVLGE